MDSDSESYHEEISENEQELASPLHINVQVILEESPESPQPVPPSPLLPPETIPEGELSPVWELPDERSNFNFFYKSRCVPPKTMVSDNALEEKRTEVYGRGANVVSKYCFVPHRVSQYSMRNYIPAGSGGAVVRPVIGV